MDIYEKFKSDVLNAVSSLDGKDLFDAIQDLVDHIGS